MGIQSAVLWCAGLAGDKAWWELGHGGERRALQPLTLKGGDLPATWVMKIR